MKYYNINFIIYHNDNIIYNKTVTICCNSKCVILELKEKIFDIASKYGDSSYNIKIYDHNIPSIEARHENIQSGINEILANFEKDMDELFDNNIINIVKTY